MPAGFDLSTPKCRGQRPCDWVRQ